MIRLTIRCAFGFVCLFALALTAGRARPRDLSPIDAVIHSPGCSGDGGCFLGIEPGVTEAEQALAILQAHPWVKNVVHEARAPYDYIYWEWSGQQPAFVANPQARTPPYVWVQRQIVQFIFIPTQILYGDMQLALGAAQRGSVTISAAFSAQHVAEIMAYQTSAYFDNQLTVDSGARCPVNPDVYWNAPVTLTFNSSRSASRGFQQYRDDFRSVLYRKPCG